MSTPRWGRAQAVAFGILVLPSLINTAKAQSLSSSPFSVVALSSFTANWSSTYPGGTLYYAQLSTVPSFDPPAASSNTFGLSAAFSGLTPDTTYYTRVATAPAGPFTALGSTVPLQFVRQELPGTAGYALRIGLGDLDGDGDLDAALAQATTLNETVLRNDGGGAFTQVAISGSGGASSAIAVCDLDSDGDLDLLVGNDSGQDEVVYRNDGALSFAKITLTGTAGNTKAVSCGDYDGDGDQDALIANDTGQSLVLLRNDGGLSFARMTLSGTGANNRDVKWLDYDSDGDLDAFIAVSGDDGVLRNDGDAGFVKAALAGTGGDSVRAALADHDLDGDLDPLLTNYAGGRMALYRSDGTGGVVQFPLMSSTGTYDVAWGDYDGDGDPDALFGEVVGDDYLARNEGGGVFTRVDLTGSKGNTNSVAWGDFDADGDLDILLGKALTTNAVLLRNQGDAVNAPPGAPGGVALSFADSPSSAALTVTWSAAAYDGALSTAGLSYALVIATAPMALSGDSMRVVSPSTFVATWNHGTPPGGNAQKALYRVWPGDSVAKNGQRFRLDLDGVLRGNFKSDATYYFRLQTIDAGLARSTWSAEVSAYFLRSAPAASAAMTGPTTLTASYSTSGAAGYLLQASTAPDFSGTLLTAAASSAAASVALPGLEPATTYFLRFGAFWQTTTAWAIPTPASTAPAPGSSLSSGPFTGVSSSSLSASWTSTFPGGTLYYAQLSTNASFATPATSSNTVALSAAFSGLTPNTTYYARVATAAAGPFTALGSTVTMIQAPTSVYFDEITTHSIVASAYAPTPAFSNLGAGLSGTNVAKDGTYDGWRGERWTTMASMPAARYALKAAAVNGRIYAIGGYNGGNLTTNAEFDPVANAWTAKSAMPTARHSFSIGAVDGKVHAMGGESGSVLSTHQSYDPATNAWTTKASLPAAQSQAPTALHGGRLHLFGGFTTQTIATQRVYDPASDSWTTKADLPTPRNSAGAEVIGGRSYVVGGATGTANLAVHEAYDPATNSWSARATMPTARSLAYVGQVGGKAYVIGGEIGANPGSAANEEYDPAADTWTARAPFPTPRRWGGSATVNGKIYAIGGGNGTTLATNEEYDPGVAHVFAGLLPNTQYTFKAKARNLAGAETAESASFSTYTWAAVPAAATPTFTAVFTSSVAVAWTANGNPGGTEYRVHASTAADFNGAASSVTAGWLTALSTALAPLPPATWYFRLQARNAVGVETAFASLGSTRTRFADVPGCATTLFVQKAPGGDCTAIQACVGMVPSSLSGDVCVAVNDSATYSESVVVQNKAPNGFRIRIFAAEGSAPVVTPPAGASAGFRILNDSVTVAGLAIVTTNTVTYGILVSSSQVTLSSISVDSGGTISGAGVFLSSAGAVYYSSVTVQNADGVRVTGSSNTIAFTTASVTAFSRAGFYLNGAISTILEDSYGYGNPGYGAFLYRSHRNTLSRTTLRKLSAAAGAAGLFLNDASSNVVTASYISNAGGTGLDLFTAAHYNLIELSTITAAGSVYTGLELGFGRRNRVSRVYVHSSNGNAAAFSSGSSESLVEHSTFSTAYVGAAALSTNGSSDTLTANILYAPAGIGLGLYGSSTTISLTNAVTASASYPALYISGGGYVTIRDSSFQNSSGDGGKLQRTSYVEILRSTVAGAGGGAGLRLEGASSNTVTASRLAAPGGVGLAVGSYLELFDMTTATGAGNAFRNLAVSGSTAVSLGAAPGLELSSSVLTGDAQGSAVAFGDAVLVATFTGLAFPSGAAWSAEAALLPMGSRITVRDASGAQGGSLYENDPLSLVDWVPDLVPFVLPSAPAAPSGTVLGASSIAWTWAAVPNAQSYRVYSSSSGSLLAASASTGTVVTGLLPAATHCVVVAGVARGENGPLSPSATAHTHATAPTGLTLDQLFVSSAALSWSLEDNPWETLAELQRSTDDASYVVRAGTLASSAEDTGLLGCTSYYYRVRHKSPAGIGSPFAGPLLVRTAASTPSAPGDLSAQSVPGRRVSLTWNPSATEGIVTYRLFKDSGAGSVDYSAPYAEFGPTVFSTTTVALSSGSIHLFGLRAVHRCGVTETNTHAVASAWALESLDGVRAGIKVPATGKKISGNRVLVMAELDTGDARDVSSVRFQYRSTGTAAWTDVPAANSNHPNPDLAQPFFVHWDVTALADRAYDLRAVASDVVGASDPAPGTVTVLVDSVGYEVRETDLGGGKVKKEQAVSNETTNTVAAAESGSGVVTKVVLPPGALNTAGATLSVTPNPTALPAPPAAATSLGAALEVTLSNGQSQLSGGQTAAIVFNYPDDDGDGVIDGTQIRAEHAQIQTFDVATNRWKQEFATTVDKDKRTLTGQTPHFSLFAAFGVVQANLDAIRVYPNPYKPNGGNADEGRPFSRADPLSGVIFDNLPAVVEISIYTLTGRLVSTFGTSAGTGAVQWDGKNDQGEDVASGGYFAVIKSPGATPVIKKIGVIR